jgi:hypothetical protein
VLAVSVDFKRVRSAAMLALAGSIAVIMSNVSVIALAVAGLWLPDVALRERRYLHVAAVFAAWGGTFATYYLVFIHGHPMEGQFVRYYLPAFP